MINALCQREKRELRDLREKGEKCPDLVANETLYQLSYTPVLLAKMALILIPKIPFVHRFYPL